VRLARAHAIVVTVLVMLVVDVHVVVVERLVSVQMLVTFA
jgi:hypothetical protein